MSDETDDELYVYKDPTYPRFIIERKRRLDYFPFEKWSHWASFSTREDRDAELAALRNEHPVWQLRLRDELFPPTAMSAKEQQE